MTAERAPRARRPLRYWCGLVLLIVGALGLFFGGGVRLNSGPASRALLGQLMEPLRENMIESGVPSNVVARAMVGEASPEPELNQLTPYQQRKVEDVLTVYESQRQLSETIRTSANTGATIGMMVAITITGTGLWLIRGRKKDFTT